MRALRLVTIASLVMIAITAGVLSTGSEKIVIRRSAEAQLFANPEALAAETIYAFKIGTQSTGHEWVAVSQKRFQNKCGNGEDPMRFGFVTLRWCETSWDSEAEFYMDTLENILRRNNVLKDAVTTQNLNWKYEAWDRARNREIEKQILVRGDRVVSTQMSRQKQRNVAEEILLFFKQNGFYESGPAMNVRNNRRTEYGLLKKQQGSQDLVACTFVQKHAGENTLHVVCGSMPTRLFE